MTIFGMCAVPKILLHRGRRGCQPDVAGAADPGSHALEQHLVIVDDADFDHGVHDI
jgi:hypothetical protein